MTFRFIDESVENVVYVLSNVGAKTEKFSVDSMENCLEKIALARIFGVEQFQ